MDQTGKMSLIVKANRVFSPGTPIDAYALFAGRKEQVKDVVTGTLQAGRHIILYGERGVGKTSLAKVISEILSNAGVQVLNSGTINCDGTDNFSSLWHKIFRELSVVLEAKQVGFSNDKSLEKVCLENFLPNKKVSPDDVRYVLSQLPKKSEILILIDEIDTLKDTETTNLLANTIKNLSDHAINVTLLLVGVAESVSELIAEHKSVERALVQVPMPRMSKSELVQILETRLPLLNLTIKEDAKEWITDLSRGLPYYTHSLGLYAVIHGIEEDRTEIEMSDVAHAMRSIVKKPHTLVSAYNKAISSPQKKNIYSHVLLSCALARTDELGHFPAAAVSKPLSIIMGKKCDIPNFARHLKHFSDEKIGILNVTGEVRKLRYRFSDPMMQPFVIMHGFTDGAITQDILKKVREVQYNLSS
jgi:hypothetical protein